MAVWKTDNNIPKVSLYLPNMQSYRNKTTSQSTTTFKFSFVHPQEAPCGGRSPCHWGSRCRGARSWRETASSSAAPPSSSHWTSACNDKLTNRHQSKMSLSKKTLSTIGTLRQVCIKIYRLLPFHLKVNFLRRHFAFVSKLVHELSFLLVCIVVEAVLKVFIWYIINHPLSSTKINFLTWTA